MYLVCRLLLEKKKKERKKAYFTRCKLPHNLYPLTHSTPPHTPPLSLHDALPISSSAAAPSTSSPTASISNARSTIFRSTSRPMSARWKSATRCICPRSSCRPRSEEHTSNSSHRCISYAVFCLKKKKKKEKKHTSLAVNSLITSTLLLTPPPPTPPLFPYTTLFRSRQARRHRQHRHPQHRSRMLGRQYSAVHRGRCRRAGNQPLAASVRDQAAGRDRKSTRLTPVTDVSRMPSSA